MLMILFLLFVALIQRIIFPRTTSHFYNEKPIWWIPCFGIGQCQNLSQTFIVEEGNQHHQQLTLRWKLEIYVLVVSETIVCRVPITVIACVVFGCFFIRIRDESQQAGVVWSRCIVSEHTVYICMWNTSFYSWRRHRRHDNFVWFWMLFILMRIAFWIHDIQ